VSKHPVVEQQAKRSESPAWYIQRHEFVSDERVPGPPPAFKLPREIRSGKRIESIAKTVVAQPVKARSFALFKRPPVPEVSKQPSMRVPPV
jgi:hypothetical protein